MGHCQKASKGNKIFTHGLSQFLALFQSNFFIELALAGFKKDELTIKVEKDTLSVEGDRKKRQDNENYIYKSIGNRTFKKIFSLAELVEVKDAEFTDGVLHINLEKHIPEEDKPRNISIT